MSARQQSFDKKVFFLFFFFNFKSTKIHKNIISFIHFFRRFFLRKKKQQKRKKEKNLIFIFWTCHLLQTSFSLLDLHLLDIMLSFMILLLCDFDLKIMHHRRLLDILLLSRLCHNHRSKLINFWKKSWWKTAFADNR